MSRARSIPDGGNIRSRRRLRPARRPSEPAPEIVVHGMVDLSFGDLGFFDSATPAAPPVCDLSAVVAEVLEPTG